MWDQISHEHNYPINFGTPFLWGALKLYIMSFSTNNYKLLEFFNYSFFFRKRSSCSYLVVFRCSNTRAWVFKVWPFFMSCFETSRCHDSQCEKGFIYLLRESFIGCWFINRMNCRDNVPLVPMHVDSCPKQVGKLAFVT